MAEQTYWNGEPCAARRVRVVVGDTGRFALYWARELVGTERDAVEITYNDETFYLDDEDGSGWAAVTEYRGSPTAPKSWLDVDRIVASRDSGVGSAGA